MSANPKSSFLSNLWSRELNAPPPELGLPAGDSTRELFNETPSSALKSSPQPQSKPPATGTAQRLRAKAVSEPKPHAKTARKQTKVTKTEMRLVSHQGHRYAFKLEPVFWHILQFAADSKNQKIGPYIGPLLESAQKGANKTSALRTHAAEWMCRQLANTATKVVGPKTLENLSAAIPAPALAMNQDDQIIGQNHLFLDLLRNLVDGREIGILGTIRLKFARELSAIKSPTQDIAESYSNEKVIIQSNVGEWAFNCRVVNIRSTQGSSLGLLIIVQN